jgi:tetratricopeptide (TPR) repeat protein
MHRAAGELDKAIAEYAEAVKLDPHNVKALLLQSIALVNADQIAKAQPLLEQAKKMAPAGPLAYFAEALIDCKQKRYQPCGDNLERIFAILPQYMPALLLSGQRNYAIGSLETAQDTLVRYLRKAPADTRRASCWQ